MDCISHVVSRSARRFISTFHQDTVRHSTVMRVVQILGKAREALLLGQFLGQKTSRSFYGDEQMSSLFARGQ